MARDDVTKRAEAAIGLRVAGASYDEIATALGYADARRALIAVEGELSKQATMEDRSAERELASRRLERLLRAVWPKAIDDQSGEQMVAVRAAKDLIDRQIKLLGLDVPQEIIIRNPTETAISAWVAKVAAIEMPQVEESDVLAGLEEIQDAEMVE